MEQKGVMTLDEALSKPGIYAVAPSPKAIGFSMIEVAADLTCYQLTLRGMRDGVLSRDGWNPQTVVLGHIPHPRSAE